MSGRMSHVLRILRKLDRDLWFSQHHIVHSGFEHARFMMDVLQENGSVAI